MSKLTLTPRQSDVIRKMSEGWELVFVPNKGFYLNGEGKMSAVHGFTVHAIGGLGLIGIGLTPAGIEAAKRLEAK